MPEAPAADVPGPIPVGAPTSVAPESIRSLQVRPGGPRLPVRLQPMTVSDLIDGAWSVISSRPQTVFGLSGLVLAPAAIVASALARQFGDSLDTGTKLHVFYPWVHIDSRVSPGWPQAIIGVMVMTLATFVLGVAIARLVDGWYEGHDLTAMQALGQALRRTPAILGAYALVLIPKAASIAAFLVPAWFLFPFFLLVAPVIAIEQVGPWRAIRRSASLVGRRYVAVLAMWTVWLVTEQLISYAVSVLPQLLKLVLPAAVGDLLDAAGWAFVAFMTTPAVAGMAVLLYLDLRVRTEGLDIELDAREAFAGA